MLQRLFYSAYYWFTQPPWDTNITPPEVVALIEVQKLPAGRALDLGCGTGTNTIYLAKHGWDVVGVDFVGKAIATAKRKAQAAGASIQHIQGDVTKLDFLSPPFDLALDIGCFHNIPANQRTGYISGLERLLRPGGTFLCYAFKPGAMMGGLSVDDMQQLFSPAFTCANVEHGQGTPSAWYTFTRN